VGVFIPTEFTQVIYSKLLLIYICPDFPMSGFATVGPQTLEVYLINEHSDGRTNRSRIDIKKYELGGMEG
jgi:hypothetical protein